MGKGAEWAEGCDTAVQNQSPDKWHQEPIISKHWLQTLNQWVVVVHSTSGRWQYNTLITKTFRHRKSIAHQGPTTLHLNGSWSIDCSHVYIECFLTLSEPDSEETDEAEECGWGLEMDMGESALCGDTESLCCSSELTQLDSCSETGAFKGGTRTKHGTAQIGWLFNFNNW